MPKEDIVWEKNKSYITIVNDKHYDSCATIKSIDNINKTISVAQKDFPFSKRVIMDENELDWDDYGIFVADMPTAGEVDLGKYTTAIGENNVVSERAATAIGRENIVQGKYGVALGRGNIIKAYAGVAIGAYNIIEADALYSSADGLQNTVTAPTAHAGGYQSKATEAYAHAEGHTTEASGVASHSQGRETVASGAYAHAGGYKTTASGESSTAFGVNTIAEGRASLASGLGVKATRSNSTWFGQYNDPKNNHIFGVGLGGSDTNRANAFVIETSGNANFFKHRATNIADAVVDTDAVSLK